MNDERDTAYQIGRLTNGLSMLVENTNKLENKIGLVLDQLNTLQKNDIADMKARLTMHDEVITKLKRIDIDECIGTIENTQPRKSHKPIYIGFAGLGAIEIASNWEKFMQIMEILSQ